MSGTGKSTGTESRLEVARGGVGEGEDGELLFNKDQFFVRADESWK